jgi:hypothetical protein
MNGSRTKKEVQVVWLVVDSSARRTFLTKVTERGVDYEVLKDHQRAAGT